MLKLRFINPYSGTKLVNGTRVPWEVADIGFLPREIGDPEPDGALLAVIQKECLKEDGLRPSRDELKAYKLQQGMREAFAVAFYDFPSESWPSIEEVNA